MLTKELNLQVDIYVMRELKSVRISILSTELPIGSSVNKNFNWKLCPDILTEFQILDGTSN